ncbi:DUF4249 domain-containing protein [Daejeonella lutea]|uniref:DUF4249 domain-containing protein n=1 Tax=Daejeonella lutea TaxID=572036 RepID=A0A1T5BRI7_9SPHI|nr:DUF4249 domain-containing protein [Daejeonella lutea]SKB49741.1 protein of unknown function [Daejeonella lutea]
MKQLINYTYFLIATAILCSCEKVIDVNLSDSESKYVIEGIVTNEAGSSRILVTRSNNFADGSYENIRGALVEVESNGTVTTFTEANPGVYRNTAFKGNSGNVYNLRVVINGQTFTSKSTMPARVTLDSLFLTVDNLDKTTRYATVSYRDPRGRKNYYRFIQFKNGKKEKSIFTESDEFSNGDQVETQLDNSDRIDDSNPALKKGDLLEVEMQCIDAAVYKYWFSVVDGGANGNSENAAPANPVTNIIGGALGYFSAHTMQKKSLIIP